MSVLIVLQSPLHEIADCMAVLCSLYVVGQAVELADLAIGYRDKGVVAVDIAGDELIPMSSLHLEAFKVIMVH